MLGSGGLPVIVTCSFIAFLSISVCGETVTQEAESVLLPAGEFLMGVEGDAEDNPVHKVFVDSFYMDKYEVTNEQYLAFCQATGRRLLPFIAMY